MPILQCAFTADVEKQLDRLIRSVHYGARIPITFGTSRQDESVFYREVTLICFISFCVLFLCLSLSALHL